MKLKRLRLRDYRGHPATDLAFGDFACLIGQNGVGKTTVLNAVALLCSSLDFKQIEFEGSANQMEMKVTPEQRLRACLASHVRNGAKDFLAEGTFEHEGQEYVVSLTKEGFARNELLKSRFWWPGIYYFARFDSDMVNFQLPYDRWERFSKAYSAITGIDIEPEVFEESDMVDMGLDGRVVVGFWLNKKMGKIHSKESSAGEKKTSKILSQVVNIELHRQPHIILCDNIEMHIHHSRHLKAVQALKDLFGGKQLISTTHSMAIINEYEPREHIIDLEKIVEI